MMNTELNINLQDTQWQFEYVDHDRNIARAIVYDESGQFYFVRAERDDDFGKAITIETAGGGVEDGEDLITAIRRELKEELGVQVEVVCKIGVVSDYYNLIHRHNILSLIHISEPTRRTPISYAVFCLKKKKKRTSRPVSYTYIKTKNN